MIANETTIQQSSNDMYLTNQRSSYSLIYDKTMKEKQLREPAT